MNSKIIGAMLALFSLCACSRFDVEDAIVGRWKVNPNSETLEFVRGGTITTDQPRASGTWHAIGGSQPRRVSMAINLGGGLNIIGCVNGNILTVRNAQGTEYRYGRVMPDGSVTPTGYQSRSWWEETFEPTFDGCV